MRPPGRTFWLLDGRNGWRSDPSRSDDVSQSGAGLALEADPDGRLALESVDGSLGGLTMPRGMALDETNLLYLLESDEPRIRRLDVAIRRFVRLPDVGGRGTEARQFRDPTNIAIAGSDLFVVDRGNSRVQVFDLKTLALRFVWGPFNDRGCAVASDHASAWWPVDVAVGRQTVYLLDQRYNRIYAHRLGTDGLCVLVDAGEPRLWSRLAVDRHGCIYALDVWSCRLHVYDSAGRPLGTVDDAGDVRDRFDPPPIRLDHRGRFCLPETFLRPCNRQASPPPLDHPLQPCIGSLQGGIVFSRRGRPVRVEPGEPPGPRTYLRCATWVSEPLDSKIYRCSWHRVELELADLPAGSQVTVSTFTSVTEEGEPADFDAGSVLRQHLWKTRYTITGPTQPRGALTAEKLQHEFLVQSEEGQYLRLRIALSGDGYGTPVVRSVRVHYPRQSYLQYLPAIYAAQDDAPSAYAASDVGDAREDEDQDAGSALGEDRSPGRRFLERFLSIFQTTWDDLEQRVEEMPAYVDPAAVPEGDHLTFLAHWLGVSLETSRDWSHKRRLLVAAPKLQPRRGTPDGLRDHLRIHLESIAGIPCEEQQALGYPTLAEGFRERQHLMLSLETTAELGHGGPLWGRDRVARLQLGVFAREGEVRLVSTGDPERDVFREYAHRFRVFVPAAWIRTHQAEAMLRRAIDDQKPAHAAYDLCLVEAAFRVGLQSTVGVDTIVGDLPKTQLTCADDVEASPHQQFQLRLGQNSVLAGTSGDEVRPRIGVDFQIGRTSMLS